MEISMEIAQKMQGRTTIGLIGHGNIYQEDNTLLTYMCTFPVLHQQMSGEKECDIYTQKRFIWPEITIKLYHLLGNGQNSKSSY